MASLKTVTSKIAAFALIYRPNMSLQECQILSTEYQQSFQNLSDAEFLDAANLVKEKCTFFPTPADIYKAYQSQSSKEQAKKLSNELSNELAFEYTPEKAELNKTYAKIFMQALHGNQKAKDFFTLNLSPNSPEWKSQVAELSQNSSPAQKDLSDAQKSQKLKTNCAQKDQNLSPQASPHARPVPAQILGQVPTQALGRVPGQTSTPVSQNKPVPELIHT